MLEWLKNLRQHLLTGVSYAIPFVACGGILIAAALAFAPPGESNAPDPSKVPILQFILTVGVASFNLLLPILSMYIAYSVAGRPGLVAGAIGGVLCNDLNGLFAGAHLVDPDRGAIPLGFLGALLSGLFAGYIVELIKRLPMHRLIKPIMPILIIPVVSSLAVALAMVLVIGPPIADLMGWLTEQLELMGTGNQVLLGAVLGAMIAFDMGGPVNKVAFFFGAAMIKEGNYQVMGACAAAICTPPLGMGLATVIGRKLWTSEQRESGYAALGMGMIGITEGAIPFAAADPLRVIPCIMFGSVVASTIAMLGGVGNHAPHGGPIVLPVIDNKVMYVVAIAAGTIVTALAINMLKTKVAESQPEDSGP
ncbi:MAG: PTS fructose transporter subunit IIC [Phycisphaerales bacterium]|nr:PTS fructose transporter subunit IIC [Phycisphaerales bacterium]